jgi:hypothetical protein
MISPKPMAGSVLALLAGSTLHCGSHSGNPCTPPDQDDVSGGSWVFFVSVSDTAFSVGGVDSGSNETNITAQNLGQITLTLTNTGTKPHDMKIGCLPSGLPAGCAAISCFPADANIATLKPQESVTTSFVSPAVEGAYPFFSDEPGDMTTSPDGGTTGLVGTFVLM